MGEYPLPLQPVIVDEANDVTGELQLDVEIWLPNPISKGEIDDVKLADPQGFLVNLAG
jgi:hypothetical protein